MVTLGLRSGEDVRGLVEQAAADKWQALGWNAEQSEHRITYVELNTRLEDYECGNWASSDLNLVLDLTSSRSQRQNSLVHNHLQGNCIL